MPLVQGASKQAFARNVRTLVHEGRPTKQAVAIAYNVQREAQRKAGKRATPGPRSVKLTRSRNGGSVQGMAKRRKARRSSKAITRHSSAPASRAHRAARAVGGIAQENKHMTGAVLGAAALGFAKKQGYEIPHVKTVGEAGSLALAGYLMDKFGIYRARWLRHATTGFACIAVYEMASTGNIPLISPKATTSGDEAGYEVR